MHHRCFSSISFNSCFSLGLRPPSLQVSYSFFLLGSEPYWCHGGVQWRRAWQFGAFVAFGSRDGSSFYSNDIPSFTLLVFILFYFVHCIIEGLIGGGVLVFALFFFQSFGLFVDDMMILVFWVIIFSPYLMVSCCIVRLGDLFGFDSSAASQMLAARITGFGFWGNLIEQKDCKLVVCYIWVCV